MKIPRLRDSMLLKVALLCLIGLLLCIPLARIEGLIEERGRSRHEAQAELAETYAGDQTLVGPILVVPYTERWNEVQRDSHGKVTGSVPRSRSLGHVVFPATLDLQGRLLPQERYRGIFRVPFYTLDGQLSGRFDAFDPKTIPHSEPGSTLELDTPFIAMGLSDLRGLSGSPQLRFAGETLAFAQRVPGLDDSTWLSRGIHAPLAGAALAAWRSGQPADFTLALSVVGQERLAVAPLGAETTASLSSPWAHPSFGGRFLATERSVRADGFDARWRISALVSAAREQVRASMQPVDVAARGARPASGARDMPALETFDVALSQPVNVYTLSTRAVKYGAMFVALVLMAAFMAELFGRLRLHPVQYALVGLSIALFFLLLVALSEKLLFWQAYAAASCASVLLLVAYFSAVLRGWRRGAGFGAYVAVLYGALYGLLASESNALLLGALLMFGMLALLMLATRNVDWYAVSDSRARPARDSLGGAMAPPVSSSH